MAVSRGFLSTLKLGYIARLCQKAPAAQEPDVSGRERTGHCTECGHKWGPDYVWLGALMQVSPLPGTCSFEESSTETHCECRTRGHFSFSS